MTDLDVDLLVAVVGAHLVLDAVVEIGFTLGLWVGWASAIGVVYQLRCRAQLTAGGRRLSGADNLRASAQSGKPGHRDEYKE